VEIAVVVVVEALTAVAVAAAVMTVAVEEDTIAAVAAVVTTDTRHNISKDSFYKSSPHRRAFFYARERLNFQPYLAVDKKQQETYRLKEVDKILLARFRHFLKLPSRFEMSQKAKFIDNLNIPVVAAPMFLISGPQLVIECCKNGIIGTFPALNHRSTDGFESWVIEIKQALEQFEKETGKKAAPFGVNLIVHHTNPRLQADLEICIKHEVPLIITSLGAVTDLIDQVHDYGGLVFHDVIKRRHAEKAAEAGVDGLILVSAGAGGHAGNINPMSLVAEIKGFFSKTILLSGCISTGRDIASALQMGADLAYMGTRFINTKESKADEGYQQMIIDSGSSDIVYTAAVSGVHANFLRSSLEAIGITEELWSKKAKVDFGEELDAEKAEAKAWKTIWSAGQGVTTIHDVLSVNQLVNRLKHEFIEALQEQSNRLEKYKSQL
jgi:nitronate monooxygenase